MKLPVSGMPRLRRAAIACVTMAMAAGSLYAQAPAATVAPPAIDFKEDAAAYTVRIVLPADEASKFNFKMDGDRLKLSVPNGNGSVEQSYQFPEADLSKSPAVRRDGDAVVISIPKAPSKAVASADPATPADPAAQTGDDQMDQQINAAFTQMQRQMNQAMKAMQNMGGANGFGSALGNLLQNAQAGGSSYSLEETPENYIIHAHIPGDTLGDVHVSVDNGMLKITGSSQSGRQSAGFTSSASFTQYLQLPGPVRGDKITLDHKDGDLLITLPRT